MIKFSGAAVLVDFGVWTCGFNWLCSLNIASACRVLAVLIEAPWSVWRPGGRAGDPQTLPYIVFGEWYPQKHFVKATKKGTFQFCCGVVPVYEERPSQTPLEPPELPEPPKLLPEPAQSLPRATPEPPQSPSQSPPRCFLPDASSQMPPPGCLLPGTSQMPPPRCLLLGASRAVRAPKAPPRGIPEPLEPSQSPSRSPPRRLPPDTSSQMPPP